MLALLVVAYCASPVQKVIELLGDLEAKVEADLANEAKLMDEYTAWCGSEANEKEDAITSSKRTISDLQATIEDQTAQIQTLTTDIEGLTGSISSAEGDLKQATAIRNKENSDFSAAEKELSDTVDTLERAGAVLKKNLGFLQGGVSKKIQLMTAGLSKVIEASWVNEHQRAVLKALLQTGSSDSDEDLQLQPQATTSAYESKSDGILDTIADMQAKAEDSLMTTRKDEMAAQHAYQMLKQGLEDEIKVKKQQLSESSLRRTAAQEALHQAEAGLAETKKVLKEDQQYLAELRQGCKTKDEEWAERQRTASDETAAIRKAKDILADGVKESFLQTSSRTRRASVEESGQARTQVVALLQRLGKQFGSFAFQQLSARARSDPFGKIRNLIESMVTRLEKEAAAEATQKAFCDEEQGESKAKQANLVAQLEKSSARIEKAEADKALLLEDIKTLEGEIAEAAQNQAVATKQRIEQHEEFLKASKDFKDSASAVEKAIEVLTQYYSAASSDAALVQGGSSAPDFGSAKSDVSSTIVSVLEVAEADFTRLLAEAEAAENEEKRVYDKLTQDMKVLTATKQQDAKGKAAQVKQLEVALGNWQDDKATTGSELDAVLAYLDKLKPQCATEVMSYGERKARREQEISGLKEALSILSESSL